ncbi:deoxyribodipyrimidine photo-lyase [Veronia nyctiphanis]|uniref:Deoxyribodipyrimidine photo-lyase n=1 Tax=Veronia nyctiphanis TaxID=1278244 RepID=A0A4Q0YTM2_9GAMM|nr:deoxyribodipyrimidine photo-lyase [Veronia nyctiphanis]RXJ74596.1 deoxyribodipyrimidine photo-lyase [Veronia nyctiphanis]
MKLVWFRRDLRVKDNPALHEACKTGEPTIALYTATPEQWKQHDLSPRQADFIQRRLEVLRNDLAALNIPLLFKVVDDFSGLPAYLAEVCQQYQVSDVYCNIDYEFDEVDRDNAVAGTLSLTRTGFHAFHGKCILPPGSVLTGGGKSFQVFTPFKRAWLKLVQSTDYSPVKPPLPISPTALTKALIEDAKEIDLRYWYEDSVSWPVDDNTIIQRLRDYCSYRVTSYDALRDIPSEPATSQLSAYLAIGAISPRQCLARLLTEHPNAFDDSKQGPQVWLSELIWREFYQHVTASNPSLSKGKACLSWESNIEWKHDEILFERWKQGKTGVPIVDAGMRQLNETGWMHNRLRMIVASFLVKDLHIDWRWGERYFMQKLIDGDFAANNGGWQWSASVGLDAQPYFRIFNPFTQSKKFDPEGIFIRRWVKELENIPEKFIHDPYHKNYGSDVSLSYPKPIVDHALRERRHFPFSKLPRITPVSKEREHD